MQKLMWDRIRVRRLSSIFMEMKRSISPMAVTMSGFITGRLLISSTMFFSSFLDFERPMAAIVPTMVETTVAMTATRTV